MLQFSFHRSALIRHIAAAALVVVLMTPCGCSKKKTPAPLDAKQITQEQENARMKRELEDIDRQERYDRIYRDAAGL